MHFNGPRAGVNFNDGFGGGDVLERNLLANCVRDPNPNPSPNPSPTLSPTRYAGLMPEGANPTPTPTPTPAPNQVRESGDHGPFNSWDRVPYISTLRYGPDRPSVLPAWRHLRRNFFLSNYASQEVRGIACARARHSMCTCAA